MYFVNIISYNVLGDKGIIDSVKKGLPEDGLVYHAGFPNAGEDQHGTGLSLDGLVIKHRASTYFWRLETAVLELHWAAGSIVVVDRALPARDGRIVVAIVDEGFALCRMRKNGLFLLDGTRAAPESQLWGVVSHVVQEVV